MLGAHGSGARCSRACSQAIPLIVALRISGKRTLSKLNVPSEHLENSLLPFGKNPTPAHRGLSIRGVWRMRGWHTCCDLMGVANEQRCEVLKQEFERLDQAGARALPDTGLSS